MIASEFASYARTGGESLQISDVTVEAGSQTSQLDGKLRIDEGHFKLELNIPADVTLPGITGHNINQNSWLIGGQIENNLHFSCRAVLKSWSPFPEFGGSTSFISTSLTISENNREQDATSAEDTPLFRGFALLPNVELLGANCATRTDTVNDFLGKSWNHRIDTLKGETGEWEFGLIPTENDLTVHLRYRRGFPVTEETARRTFRGLLSAISFTHGIQVWPQHFQLWRDHRKLEDTVTPARRFSRSNHPFLFPKHCVIATDLVSALTKVTLFLSQNDEFTREIERLMFLARLASTGDTPMDVGTLSLCAVFEGLVAHTFKHFGMEEAVLSNSEELKEFARAKTELIRHVRELQGFPSSVIERLQGGLAWMTPIRFKEKSRAVVDQLGLPWDGVMEIAFRVWDEERGRLAHGARVRSECDEDLWESWRNQSCLGCAINILFARLCGYSGVAMYSTVEEKTDIRI